jgi:hypothetical protein
VRAPFQRVAGALVQVPVRHAGDPMEPKRAADQLLPIDKIDATLAQHPFGDNAYITEQMHVSYRRRLEKLSVHLAVAGRLLEVRRSRVPLPHPLWSSREHAPREAGYSQLWRRLAPVAGMPVESAFTRFIAYVVARIVRRPQKLSYPGNVDSHIPIPHRVLIFVRCPSRIACTC